jgi:hypothetical protein
MTKAHQKKSEKERGKRATKTANQWDETTTKSKAFFPLLLPLALPLASFLAAVGTPGRKGAIVTRPMAKSHIAFPCQAIEARWTQNRYKTCNVWTWTSRLGAGLACSAVLFVHAGLLATLPEAVGPVCCRYLLFGAGNTQGHEDKHPRPADLAHYCHFSRHFGGPEHPGTQIILSAPLTLPHSNVKRGKETEKRL